MPLQETAPHIDARLFVRHSDGESFVVPRNFNKLGRVSFRLHIADSNFETLKQAVHNDEDYGFNDFEPQFYLGSRHRLQNTTGGLVKIETHGYMAQMWPGRDSGDQMNRTTLDRYDVMNIVRSRDDFDYFDRELARCALQRLPQFV